MICRRNNQEERATENLFPVFGKLTESCGLLFAGDKIVIPEVPMKQVVEAVHCTYRGSSKTLAESSILYLSGLRKYIEKMC